MKKNLELYIHTPFCMKKCDYCDFLSFSADGKTQEDYVRSLLAEILTYGAQMQEYEVSTVYIGGGTPTWLDENLMLAIVETLYQNFDIRSDAEISIECNPGTVTRGKLESYHNAGINRLSIGLQSADNEELKILGRIHTYEQFLKTYEMARNVGFSNINVDLISGLPNQTAEKFAKTLQQVIRLKPEHISAYTLIIEKGTPFYERYKFDAVRQESGMETEVLPNEDEAYRIYKTTQFMLTEAGYEQYEISNYAKSRYACKHNIGYWTRENYLGLGLGAASLVENVRYSNTRDIYTYIKGDWREEETSVERKAQMEEFMFLGLRMNAGVARADFEKAFAMPIEAVYRDVMEELKKEELLIVRSGRIALTDKGMDLANYVMSRFLLE